jgi:hypothetical protein
MFQRNLPHIEAAWAGEVQIFKVQLLGADVILAVRHGREAGY